MAWMPITLRGEGDTPASPLDVVRLRTVLPIMVLVPRTAAMPRTSALFVPESVAALLFVRSVTRFPVTTTLPVALLLMPVRFVTLLDRAGCNSQLPDGVPEMVAVEPRPATIPNAGSGPVPVVITVTAPVAVALPTVLANRHQAAFRVNASP